MRRVPGVTGDELPELIVGHVLELTLACLPQLERLDILLKHCVACPQRLQLSGELRRFRRFRLRLLDVLD